MKPQSLFVLLSVLAVPVASPAAVVVTSPLLGLSIPDDSNTGLAQSLTVSDSLTILGLEVTLSLSVPQGGSGWIGDLYAYVQHDSGVSILLNRPGRSILNIGGYDDDQPAALTFGDNAPNGDVHSYRLSLTGDAGTPLGGPLSGRWQPDGRESDPAIALATDPRTALLGSFVGSDAVGSWRLFVADLSSGGEFQLDQWRLEFNGDTAIPEPMHFALMTGVLIGGLAWLRHRRICRGP